MVDRQVPMDLRATDNGQGAAFAERKVTMAERKATILAPSLLIPFQELPQMLRIPPAKL